MAQLAGGRVAYLFDRCELSFCGTISDPPEGSLDHGGLLIRALSAYRVCDFLPDEGFTSMRLRVLDIRIHADAEPGNSYAMDAPHVAARCCMSFCELLDVSGSVQLSTLTPEGRESVRRKKRTHRHEAFYPQSNQVCYAKDTGEDDKTQREREKRRRKSDMRLRGAIPRGTGQALAIQPTNQDGESAACPGVTGAAPPVVWSNGKTNGWGRCSKWRCNCARLSKQRPVAGPRHRVRRRIRDGVALKAMDGRKGGTGRGSRFAGEGSAA
ncbi:hypothetical protein BBK36DRAFT_23903 [Trichoderma citrinoviride]|uniref:Uncharacterized protein n=1 Tax=Trichoderma citrinoviride TaxID=58853 RepID=A0A2T4AYA9_9HYPO|nr:hypothetical protein BBK36DRAFT_23903 [Trichoderma citrinoviride]PTB62047.1 hypothetical protein BBK36DRAFT_23903 [Trichoderma citrinoviride]